MILHWQHRSQAAQNFLSTWAIAEYHSVTTVAAPPTIIDLPIRSHFLDQIGVRSHISDDLGVQSHIFEEIGVRSYIDS